MISRKRISIREFYHGSSSIIVNCLRRPSFNGGTVTATNMNTNTKVRTMSMAVSMSMSMYQSPLSTRGTNINTINRRRRCYDKCCTDNLIYRYNSSVINRNRNDSDFKSDVNSISNPSSVSVGVEAYIPDDIHDLVEVFLQKESTKISLDTLMKTGRGELLKHHPEEDSSSSSTDLFSSYSRERIYIQVANFIRHEMPIRLAHRIRDLDEVPMMRDMPSVQAVKNIYINSFLELIDQPVIRSPEDEEDFAHTLEMLYRNHSNVLIQMARGAYELREAVRSGKYSKANIHNDANADVNINSASKVKQGQGGENNKNDDDIDFAQMEECHSFLNRFYMSRIGIRVLAGQYLALRKQPRISYSRGYGSMEAHQPERTYIGMICSHTSPYEIVQHAADDATKMCLRKYNIAPKVIIQGRIDLTFSYIPTHLHYILLELLKNAMRATVETHHNPHHSNEAPLPPVIVIIADAPENEDIVIKVADEGGGIARSQINHIWSYLYTTAEKHIQDGFLSSDEKIQKKEDHTCDSPLAGLGYGLPISRSYARYFGGDLNIMSMEGFGTDAFVYLVRLEKHSLEPPCAI